MRKSNLKHSLQNCRGAVLEERYEKIQLEAFSSSI